MKRYLVEWPLLVTVGMPAGWMALAWSQTEDSAAAMMSSSCCWRMSAICWASAADW